MNTRYVIGRLGMSELEQMHFEAQRRANYVFLVLSVVQITLFAALFIWQGVKLDTAPSDVLTAVNSAETKLLMDIQNAKSEVAALAQLVEQVHDAGRPPRVFAPERLSELRDLLGIAEIEARLAAIEKQSGKP